MLIYDTLLTFFVSFFQRLSIFLLPFDHSLGSRHPRWTSSSHRVLRGLNCLIPLGPNCKGSVVGSMLSFGSVRVKKGLNLNSRQQLWLSRSIVTGPPRRLSFTGPFHDRKEETTRQEIVVSIRRCHIVLGRIRVVLFVEVGLRISKGPDPVGSVPKNFHGSIFMKLFFKL